MTVRRRRGAPGALSPPALPEAALELTATGLRVLRMPGGKLAPVLVTTAPAVGLLTNLTTPPGAMERTPPAWFLLETNIILLPAPPTPPTLVGDPLPAAVVITEAGALVVAPVAAAFSIEVGVGLRTYTILGPPAPPVTAMGEPATVPAGDELVARTAVPPAVVTPPGPKIIIFYR